MPIRIAAKLSISFLFLIFLVACSKQAAPDADSSVRTITVMTFNVENLFDNNDDPGKNDRTYFVIEDKQSNEHRNACARIKVDRWRDECLHWDWSDEIVDRKLTVIANAILQVNDGQGADIIALQEVENLSILERLRTKYLVDAGYLPAILIEGQDIRGIDVALLSKLPLADEPILHEIVFDDEFASRVGDTRGILQADFVLPGGSILTGYAVHFPAPFHPTKMRETAYKRLNQLKEALPEGRAAFAGGDFNTTSSEDREKDMLGRLARPYWTVAHETGCGDCRGTQYYARDDSWSFLDMLLWSPAANRGENATWALRKDSVRIANESGRQRREDGRPARFSMPEGGGVSDHWPVVMTLELK
jgi:endonuclease/exonuclease/phosphatase family metal-dependent hydrolase